MNCFELQNRTSDYLDDHLEKDLLKEAEAHLKDCDECSERLKRYQVILSTLNKRPKSALPSQLRNAPFSSSMSRPQTARIALSRWEQVPWYFRITLEAVGIVVFISIGISSAPKMKALYERSVEKNIAELKESLNITEGMLEGIDPQVPTPLADRALPPPIAHPVSGDELSGEDDSDDNTDDDVKVGRSQLWRFTLKTVSPDDLRPIVIKTLTELNIPENTPGLGGTQVPGGIEFDLLLPQHVVPNIKKALQKIAPKSNAHSPEENQTMDTFSWYMVKSKRKVPEGKSQVVIWLSQPTNIQ